MSDETPFTTASKEFNTQVSAQGLFFKGAQKALRVEAATIAKEFSDGAYIGTDPDGALFFNGYDDFDINKNSDYKVEQVTANGQYYAVVSFTEQSDDKSCWAKFVANDPKKTVTNTGMDGYSDNGAWTDRVMGSTTAIVSKSSVDTKVKIDSKSLKLSGSWTVPSDFAPKTPINVHGALFFKQLGDISNGVYANYSSDRIVFYNDDYTGKDFQAYFIPDENRPQSLTTSSDSRVFSGVVWSTA